MFENGSIWIKADFHLHTKADKEFGYTQSEEDRKNGYSPENTFSNDYVNSLKTANINIGMITNHNKFDKNEFDCLRKKAKKENIFLIPGVELSVNEGANGVHVLIAFSDEWISDGKDFINPFLTSVFAGKIPEAYENENGKTDKNLIDVIQSLNGFNKDYFIIFAHVEQTCGLFNECKGGKLQEWTNDCYASLRAHTLGLQKVRTEEKRDNFKRWLNGWYLAEVEGSDCKSLSEIGAKSGECWLKLGELSFSAVKYALQDYSERVKKMPPKKIQHSYIKSIAFDGGVLDGKKISFSPELNTLIGIRGSGKSSVLEALRYGLGIKMQANTSDKDYKENLVNYMIGSGGKITIEAVDRFGQEYIVSRIMKSLPDVYIDETIRPGLSICETVVHKPLYFGQKELSSSSESFGNDLVEKLVGNKLSDIHIKIENQKQKIQNLVFSLSKTTNVEEALAENKKKLADAEYNLQKFSDFGIDEKLKKQTAFTADEHWLYSVTELFADFEDKNSFSMEQLKNKLNELLTYSSQYNKENLSAIKDNLTQLYALICDLYSVYQKIFDKINAFFDLSDEFMGKRKVAEEEFAKIRRELETEIRKNGQTPLNIDDFKNLNTRIIQTKEMIEALKLQKDESSRLHSELLNELSVLNELHREEFKIIQSELTKINSTETGLSIKAEFKEEKNAFLALMKNTFRGTKIRENLYKEIVDEYTDFSAIYRDKDFYSKYPNIKVAFEPVFSAQLSALLTYRVPDKITILYRGKELRQHSLGQRASALILFILSSQESDVIVIDQPEDDLDNQTIYNDVIKLLKKVKPNVQCIFATHNANFPVLGDAEMVHSFDFSDSKLSILSGNIDSCSTQKQIIGIMEGGKEAFSKRQEIYQSWKL